MNNKVLIEDLRRAYNFIVDGDNVVAMALLLDLMGRIEEDGRQVKEN